MNQSKLVLVIAVVLLAGVGAGCKSRSGEERADGAAGQTMGGTGTGAQTGATRGGTMGPGSALDGEAGKAGPTASLKNRTIYFDFDKDEVKAEYRDIVTANARYLAANSRAHVRLEGNTDERGSREYNIGLGERRAQAVKQAMLLQGATAAQLATVSYGEERPVATGSDEDSWALNRRVEIVYVP